MSTKYSPVSHPRPARSNARRFARSYADAVARYGIEPLEPRTLLSVTYALSTLTSFNGATGSNPQSALVADAIGNLYGTTRNGGANNDGTVFELAASTNTLTTLVTFNGTNGQYPEAGLVADANGNLYGTTNVSGANTFGTVFEIDAATHSLTTLAAFTGSNGAFPQAALITDATGNLYGTTWGGGTGYGTVYKIAAGSHALTTLAAFNNLNGNTPQGSLIADAAGNLYGTTYWGGDHNLGTVFQVTANTNTLTALLSFDGTNGSNPQAGLISDSLGNLYGTTALGGAYANGTVFTLAASSHALTTLVSFNGSNGRAPESTLLADASGNLYGTTYGGGAASEGTVFEMDAANHTITTLISFNTTNGANPQTGLIADANGNLFGTTNSGGPNNDGTAFQLIPITSGTTNTTLIVTGPDAGNTTDGPLVKVFDPTTGNQNFSFLAYDRGFLGAVRVAIGDFNSDGTPDIVTATGAGGQPLINVYDGKTGIMFAEFYAYTPDYLGGVEIAVADVTGSGHPDIITSTDAGGMPLVNVFNSSGSLLLNFYAYDPNYIGGVRIASGYFAATGKTQIITSTAAGLPLINVFNGSGLLVGNFWGDDPSYMGGLQITSGDFTNAGRDQVATLRDQATPVQVKLFNLSTQQQFATLTLSDSSLPPHLRLAAADANGDGVADIITVPTSGNAPMIEIFSGVDGTLIRKWSAYASTVTCGLFVAAG